MKCTAEEAARLSNERSFSLWYDPIEGCWYDDYVFPDTCVWVMDVDHPETADFIGEMTSSVMKFIAEENR